MGVLELITLEQNVVHTICNEWVQMVEVFINVKLMDIIHTNICDSKTGAKARTGWADFVIFSRGRKVIIHIDKVFISFA